AVDMRRLAADVADQTCKTAAQSRTRFVGHRQLPWIHVHHSSSVIPGRAKREPGISMLSMPSLRDSGSMRWRGLSGMTSYWLMRPQFALALDHFGGELQIRFAADAFEIVDQHGLTVGRRLRNAHVARDHGFVDLAAHGLTDVGDDLVREVIAGVEHGQHDTVD